MNRHAEEVIRYVINGVVATAVHFGVLTYNLNVLHIPFAGLANLLASIFGILVSFIGNRYFVFQETAEGFLIQAIKFVALYAAIGFVHGLTLYIWTDLYKLSYQLGFLIAVMIQFTLGYIAGKKIIFKKIDAADCSLKVK